MKKKEGKFDVAIGAYDIDGVEVCELVGLFLLMKMKEILPEAGLYRDDGLGVTKGSRHALARLQKKLRSLFKDHSLTITVEVNVKMVDFLDVILHLGTGLHGPYRKTNDRLIYINNASNHPPNIIRELTRMVEKRLAQIPSTEAEFKAEASLYEQVLSEAGYSATRRSSSTTRRGGGGGTGIVTLPPPKESNPS